MSVASVCEPLTYASGQNKLIAKMNWIHIIVLSLALGVPYVKGTLTVGTVVTLVVRQLSAYLVFKIPGISRFTGILLLIFTQLLISGELFRMVSKIKIPEF